MSIELGTTDLEWNSPQWRQSVRHSMLDLAVALHGNRPNEGGEWPGVADEIITVAEKLLAWVDAENPKADS